MNENFNMRWAGLHTLNNVRQARTLHPTGPRSSSCKRVLSMAAKVSPVNPIPKKFLGTKKASPHKSDGAASGDKEDDEMTIMDMIRTIKRPTQKKRSATHLRQDEGQMWNKHANTPSNQCNVFYAEEDAIGEHSPSLKLPLSDDTLLMPPCKRKRKCKDLREILESESPTINSVINNEGHLPTVRKSCPSNRKGHDKPAARSTGSNGRRKISSRGMVDVALSGPADCNTQSALNEMMEILRSFSESPEQSEPSPSSEMAVERANMLGMSHSFITEPSTIAKTKSRVGRPLFVTPEATNVRASLGEEGLDNIPEDFLPVSTSGLHTCEDAGNCQNACVAKALAPNLDHMSEEELIYWYQEVTGKKFHSRSGEKVRGRIRRVIRAEVKKASVNSSNTSTISTSTRRLSSPMLRTQTQTPSPVALVVINQKRPKCELPSSIVGKESLNCTVGSGSSLQENIEQSESTEKVIREIATGLEERIWENVAAGFEQIDKPRVYEAPTVQDCELLDSKLKLKSEVSERTNMVTELFELEATATPEIIREFRPKSTLAREDSGKFEGASKTPVDVQPCDESTASTGADDSDGAFRTMTANYPSIPMKGQNSRAPEEDATPSCGAPSKNCAQEAPENIPCFSDPALPLPPLEKEQISFPTLQDEREVGEAMLIRLAASIQSPEMELSSCPVVSPEGPSTESTTADLGDSSRACEGESPELRQLARCETVTSDARTGYYDLIDSTIAHALVTLELAGHIERQSDDSIPSKKENLSDFARLDGQNDIDRKPSVAGNASRSRSRAVDKDCKRLEESVVDNMCVFECPTEASSESANKSQQTSACLDLLERHDTTSKEMVIMLETHRQEDVSKTHEPHRSAILLDSFELVETNSKIRHSEISVEDQSPGCLKQLDRVDGSMCRPVQAFCTSESQQAISVELVPTSDSRHLETCVENHTPVRLNRSDDVITERGIIENLGGQVESLVAGETQHPPNFGELIHEDNRVDKDCISNDMCLKVEGVYLSEGSIARDDTGLATISSTSSETLGDEFRICNPEIILRFQALLEDDDKENHVLSLEEYVAGHPVDEFSSEQIADVEDLELDVVPEPMDEIIAQQILRENTATDKDVFAQHREERDHAGKGFLPEDACSQKVEDGQLEDVSLLLEPVQDMSVGRSGEDGLCSSAQLMEREGQIGEDDLLYEYGSSQKTREDLQTGEEGSVHEDASHEQMDSQRVENGTVHADSLAQLELGKGGDDLDSPPQQMKEGSQVGDVGTLDDDVSTPLLKEGGVTLPREEDDMQCEDPSLQSKKIEDGTVQIGHVDITLDEDVFFHQLEDEVDTQCLGEDETMQELLSVQQVTEAGAAQLLVDDTMDEAISSLQVEEESATQLIGHVHEDVRSQLLEEEVANPHGEGDGIVYKGDHLPQTEEEGTAKEVEQGHRLYEDVCSQQMEDEGVAQQRRNGCMSLEEIPALEEDSSQNMEEIPAKQIDEEHGTQQRQEDCISQRHFASLSEHRSQQIEDVSAQQMEKDATLQSRDECISHEVAAVEEGTSPQMEEAVAQQLKITSELALTSCWQMQNVGVSQLSKRLSPRSSLLSSSRATMSPQGPLLFQGLENKFPNSGDHWMKGVSKDESEEVLEADGDFPLVLSQRLAQEWKGTCSQDISEKASPAGNLSPSRPGCGKIGNLNFAVVQDAWQDPGKFLGLIEMLGDSGILSRKRKACDSENDADFGKHAALNVPARGKPRIAADDSSMHDQHVPTDWFEANMEDTVKRRGLGDPADFLVASNAFDHVTGKESSLIGQTQYGSDRLQRYRERMYRKSHENAHHLLDLYISSSPPCSLARSAHPLMDGLQGNAGCPELTCNSTFDSETARESETCIDLLASEQLGEEDCSEDFDQPSKLPSRRKTISPFSQLELMRASSSNSPSSSESPQKIPPFRLKLPVGLARPHGESEPEDGSNSNCRHLEAEEMIARVIGKDEGAKDTILSLDSSDEDTVDSSSRQQFGSGTVEEPLQKLSLTLSPTSPSPQSVLNASNISILSQGTNVSPPTPSRGILKTGPQPCKGLCKCAECVSSRSKAGTASDFIASQMKTFQGIAGRLTKEMQDLRAVIEGALSNPGKEDEIKVTLEKSIQVEEHVGKNLSMLLRDCKRYCKLASKRPPHKIVFADEAGQKLCHVKTFKSPSVPRPLWELL